MRALAGGLPVARQFAVRSATSVSPAGPVTEVWIFDYIDSWGDPFGVSAQDVVRALSGVGDVLLHLNSPGGEVFEGISIYNALRQHPGNVTIQVEALAASAASVIAMAASEVVMMPGSMMMIHDAWDVVPGTEAELIAAAAATGKASESIAGMYAARAGGSVDEWRGRMRDPAGNYGTWYTAQEAVDAGLADRLSVPSSTVDDQAPGFAATADLTLYAGIRKPDSAPAKESVIPDTSTRDVLDEEPGFDVAAIKAALKGMKVTA